MYRRIIIIFLLVITIFGITTYTYAGKNSNISTYPEGPNITSSDRVLYFAPHPDDETIGGAGVIRYCLEHKIPIYVVVVTNGGTGALASERYNESLKAMKVLGLPRNDITFFEYPQAVDVLFTTNWDSNNPVDIGGRHTDVSYAYKDNESYTGVALEQNMETVITNFKPTIIIYPYPNDENTDHWGVSAFVEYAANNLNYTGKMYSYMVHVDTVWPFPRSYFPQDSLTPPAFLQNQISWVEFPISESDENLMLNAINCYKSQLNNDPSYLRSFVRTNQLFIPTTQITVVKNNTPTDYTKNSQFPETIFVDPEGAIHDKPPLDVVYSIIGNVNMYDLTDIGFEYNNNTTWLSLQTVGGISKRGIYNFHIRSFGNTTNNRIDVTVRNGSAHYLIYDNSSLYSNEPIKLKFKGNGIIIGIPSSLFNSPKYMISVDDEQNTKYVDRTGWYTLILQNN